MLDSAENLFHAFQSCEQNLNVTTMLPAFTLFMSTQMLPTFRIKVCTCGQDTVFKWFANTVSAHGSITDVSIAYNNIAAQLKSNLFKACTCSTQTPPPNSLCCPPYIG